MLAAAAARASVADVAHIGAQRALNREAKAFTLAALGRAGCAAFTSDANFLMVDAEVLSAPPDAAALWPRPDWLDDRVKEC